MKKKTNKKKLVKSKVDLNKQKNKHRKKLNFKKIIVLILAAYVLVYFINTVLNMPIKNIYIKNNTILSDQEIIEIAGLESYPSFITKMVFSLEKKIEKNIYIKDVEVKKSFLSTITINVVENKPVFYNRLTKRTILQDKKEVKKRYNVGTLINYVPDRIYDKFIGEISKVNQDVIERISEIEYRPNEVDDERFFLTMKDDNYVYLTLRKFTAVNDYLGIMKNISDEKGILYLEDTEFFEVLGKK